MVVYSSKVEPETNNQTPKIGRFSPVELKKHRIKSLLPRFLDRRWAWIPPENGCFGAEPASPNHLDAGCHRVGTRTRRPLEFARVVRCWQGEPADCDIWLLAGASQRKTLLVNFSFFKQEGMVGIEGLKAHQEGDVR
jgi:hypothetical protein